MSESNRLRGQLVPMNKLRRVKIDDYILTSMTETSNQNFFQDSISLDLGASKPSSKPEKVNSKMKKNQSLTSWDFRKTNEVITLHGHTEEVISLAVSSDGKWLMSSSEDFSIKVWNVSQSQEEFTLIGHSASVNSICFSSDLSMIISGSSDKIVKVWNFHSKKLEFNLAGHLKAINCVTLTKNNKFIVSASSDCSIKVWNIEERREEFSLSHPDAVSALSVSSDGKFIVGGLLVAEIKVWNFNERKEIATLSGHSDQINCLTFTPNNAFLISGSSDCSLKVWNMESMTEEFSLSNHNDWIYSVSVSSDGQFIASGALDRSIKIWNFTSRHEEFTLNGHSEGVLAVVFSPLNSYIASASSDKTVKIWNLEEQCKELTINLHDKPLTSLCISSDCKLLISRSSDSKIKVWNLEKGCEEFCLSLNKIDCMAISPDNEMLAIGSSDKGVLGVNLKDFKEEEIFQAQLEKINCLVFTPDGKSIITGSQDSKVRILNIEKKTKKTIYSHSKAVNSVSLSPDARFILSSAKDCLRIQNLEGKPEEIIITELAGFDNSASFSNDGNLIVWVSSDYFLKVWSFECRKEEFSINLNQNKAICACFSMDGKYVLCGLSDGKIRFWNIKEKTEEICLKGHLQSVNSVVCFPGGRHIASCSSDGSIKIWKLYEYSMIGASDLDKRTSVKNDSTDDFKRMKGEEGKFTSSKSFNSFYKQDLISHDSKYLCRMISNSSYDIYKSATNELYRKLVTSYEISEVIFSQDSKFLMISTVWGFDVYEILTGIILESFTIIGYEESKIILEILSKKVLFYLKKPLYLNKLTKDIIEYQIKNKCLIELPKLTLDTNTNRYFIKDLYSKSEILLRGAKQRLASKSFSNILIPYQDIFISELYHTVLHLWFYQGEEKILGKIFKPSESVLMKLDAFGRSPVFYGIKQNNINCVKIFLNYVIKSTLSNSDLYLFLSRIQNEFLLLIKFSFNELPLFLNKLNFKSEIQVIPEDSFYPGIYLNKGEAFAKISQNNKMIRNGTEVIISYFSIAVPIQIHSAENIQLLEALSMKSSIRTFKSLIIQTIIEYNWKNVKKWMISYSIVSVIYSCSFFALILNEKSNIFLMILFILSYFLIFLWEFLHLVSARKAFFNYHMKFIDFFMLPTVMYWLFGLYFKLESKNEELYLGFLVALKGMAPFKIFEETRFHYRIFMNSIDKIKYMPGIYSCVWLLSSLSIYFFSYNMERTYSEVLETEYDSDNPFNEKAIFYIIQASKILNVIIAVSIPFSMLGFNLQSLKNNKKLHSLKEKLNFALEVQKTLFFIKRHNLNKFFYVLEKKDENSEDEMFSDDESIDKDLQRNKYQNTRPSYARITDLEGMHEEKMSNINKTVRELDVNLENKFLDVEKRLQAMVSGIEGKLGANILEPDAKLLNLEDKLSGFDGKMNDKVADLEGKIGGIEQSISAILEVIKKQQESGS